ncbi:MAG: hypothetical protein RLZZ584_1918 [Pseudomonadota bacterium]
MRDNPLISLNVPWNILIRHPNLAVTSCGAGEAGAACWVGTGGWSANAVARGVGVVRRMACANANRSALR